MERMSAKEYRDLVAPAGVEMRPIQPPKRSPKRKLSIKGARPSGPPTFLAAIHRLMSYAAPRRLRIKPEEQLAISFADALRALTLQGRVRCVWTHPANEIAGRNDKLAQIRYTIAKAMGLIDGTADYVFLWADGSGALEAKVGNNGQQPNQVDFETWCKKMSVPYRTFTSVEQGIEILTDWGAILPEDAPPVFKDNIMVSKLPPLTNRGARRLRDLARGEIDPDTVILSPNHQRTSTQQLIDLGYVEVKGREVAESGRVMKAGECVLTRIGRQWIEEHGL